MTKRYLRNRKDGTIYGWDEILAANPLCYEIPESEVYPEKYVANPEPTTPTQRTRKKAVVVNEAEMTEVVKAEETPVNFSSEDFGLEAAKGWPK